MKYFKSFFKHTWHPQQMDHLNSPRRGPNPNGHQHCHQQQDVTTLAINETELGELKSSSSTAAVVSSPEIIDIASSQPHLVPCYNGACSTADLKGVRLPNHRMESPWHNLKTFFLVSIIVSLIIWIVIYVLLNQYGIVY